MSTHDFQENGEWEVDGTRADWNVTVLDCCLVDGTRADWNVTVLDCCLVGGTRADWNVTVLDCCLVDGTRADWNVTVLDCCPGNGYAHVVFTLSLRRRYKFYLMNIVLPCLMLSALILVGFLLPPDAGEKISLGISVLLAFTVFLLMIADSIPRTSLAIPLIGFSLVYCRPPLNNASQCACKYEKMAYYS